MANFKVVGLTPKKELIDINNRLLKQIKEEAGDKTIEFYYSTKNAMIGYLSNDNLIYAGDSFLMNEYKIIDWKLMNKEDYFNEFGEKTQENLMIVIVFK